MVAVVPPPDQVCRKSCHWRTQTRGPFPANEQNDKVVCMVPKISGWEVSGLSAWALSAALDGDCP